MPWITVSIEACMLRASQEEWTNEKQELRRNVEGKKNACGVTTISRFHALGGRGLVATLGVHVSTTTTGSKAAPAIALEAATALAAGTVTAATTSTAPAGAVGATVRVGASATLFNGDLLGADLVRVGSNRSRIARGISKFNKGAALETARLVYESLFAD